jgi:type-F conjugative transfer system pilin assembly protein TrbC
MIIIAIFCGSHNLSLASGIDKKEFQSPQETDYKIAQEIVDNSQKQLTLSLVENKGRMDRTQLYIFVSFNLDKPNLEQIIISANQYQAILVLRGLKNNSFKQTIASLQTLGLTEDSTGFIIDPMLFQNYQITAVPSYVLVAEKTCLPNQSCKFDYDKIMGNITARFALEKFAQSGDLMLEAAQLLKVASK